MRKRNLAIAIVTGLGMLGAAFAMVLTPPTPDAKAQALIEREFCEIGMIQSTVFESVVTGETFIIRVGGADCSGAAQTIEWYADYTSDYQRGQLNKCYNMANKVMNKPGKFIFEAFCMGGANGCDLRNQAGNAYRCTLKVAE